MGEHSVQLWLVSSASRAGGSKTPVSLAGMRSIEESVRQQHRVVAYRQDQDCPADIDALVLARSTESAHAWSYTADGMLIEVKLTPFFREHAA